MSPEEAIRMAGAIPEAEGESMRGVPLPKLDVVRVGFAGVGGQGSWLLQNVLAIDGTAVTAIFEPSAENAARALKKAEEAGRPLPAMVGDFQELCARSDVDLIYIASPWECHTPQAVLAMESGKHAAVEVPAAITLPECWALVNTSERTRKHCMMLENCMYGRPEMIVNNMVNAGLFGTITHGEAAYIHDCRGMLFRRGGWRREHLKMRDGNHYPTHGLGPVARYMGIHRGDRFERLVSMSSRPAGLAEYRDAHFPEGSPERQERYAAGDMNTSVIQTALGRTIVLQCDLVTPRPYSRGNLIQGTKGTFADYPPRVFLDGQKEQGWQSLDNFKEYEDPLWVRLGEEALKKTGHGGMDPLMNRRVMQCFHEGLPPDIDVYDAAAWSAPGPLSTLSIEAGNASLPFPDFTRGHWQ